MSGEQLAAAFSQAGAAQRIGALLDSSAGAAISVHGRIALAQGTLGGCAVHVAASDTSSAHGAIGTTEAQALIGMLEAAQGNARAVLLLLDSAGANVEQGLAALGAFRHLFRAVLKARAGQVPMLALLGRSCFGGASMLACACHARSYLPQTRLATSGPGVIQAVAGKAELDATDARAVSDLMGSAARVALHPQDSVREDTLAAARAAALAWLGQPLRSSAATADHAQFGERLRAAGIALEPTPPVEPGSRSPALAALLPRGYQPAVVHNLFCALPAAESGSALFLGALGGTAIGARHCWLLADWLLAAATTHPRSPVVLVLDARGHAARVLDERVLLSDYLVHLSRVIAHLSGLGHRVVLWIPGEASGASYVAFAAAADTVSALPSARISVLPSAAVQQILREPGQPQSQSQDWFAAGVADALLDNRLAAYHSDPGEST
jgi:acetyl-CoA carboxylase beta subunit